MARGQQDEGEMLEPLTRDVPGGNSPHVSAGTGHKGGGSQFLVEGSVPVSRVIDLDSGLQVWPKP